MDGELPDLAAALRPLVQALPRAAQPLFVARLERNSASRYREWASEAVSAPLAAGLRVCGAREEGIADIAESIFSAPESAAIVAEATESALASAGPIFDGRSLRDRFVMQAGAERSGAGIWRHLAESAADDSTRAALETCARLEEESAEFLERMLGGGAC